MNLYLVLAIALGAISGVVEAPVSQPVLATLAARRDSRANRRAVRIGFAIRQRRTSQPGWFSPRPEARGPRPAGVSRPRAPALD
jgi:hypothetical protein